MYFKIHVSLQHKQNIREDPNMDNHYKGTKAYFQCRWVFIYCNWLILILLTFVYILRSVLPPYLSNILCIQAKFVCKRLHIFAF